MHNCDSINYTHSLETLSKLFPTNSNYIAEVPVEIRAVSDNCLII